MAIHVCYWKLNQQDRLQLSSPTLVCGIRDQPRFLHESAFMIVDSRHILFSPEAIREALKTYRTLFPQKQPPGLIGPIVIRSETPLVLGVKIQAMGSSVYREIEMEESELAAMLIVYCRKLKIPLPRTGDKSLEVEGDNIALLVSKAVVDIA